MTSFRSDIRKTQPVLRTSYAGDGLLSRQIGDMDKGVIERGKDVGNAEYKFTLCDLGAERNGVLFLGCLDFLGGL